MLKDSSKTIGGPNFGPKAALIVTFLAYFGAQLITGLLIGLYMAVSGKGSDFITNFLNNSTTGQFVYMGIVQLATLGIIFWFVRRRKITLDSIGLGRGPKLSDVGNSFVYFVGYFIALAFLMAILSKLLPVIDFEQEQQIGFESAQGLWPLAMVFVSLVILPPIVEEIMIRGFLYTGLRQKMTKITAALIASFLFGMAHLQLGTGAPPLYVAAIDTFFLSLVLIHLREKTGSLWAGIFVHAFKNGLAFFVLFVLNAR